MNQENMPSENLDNPAAKPERPDSASAENSEHILIPPAEVNKKMMNQEVEEVRARQAARAKQELEELYNSSKKVESSMPELEVPRKPGFTPEEPVNRKPERKPQAPPKVESQYAEERVGAAAEQEQPQSKKEIPNEAKTEESKFNPKYESKDLYEGLGVPRDASPEDIAAAYREAAKKTHPDRGGDIKDFKAVQNAFDTLSNPDKRAKYDSANPIPKENPKAEQARPEQPRTEAPEQKAPAEKGFGQKAKEAAERFSKGAKRGAKAAAETWKAEETARKTRKTEAKSKKEAEKKKARAAEKEKIRKEAEAIKAAKAEEKKRESEKAQKEAEAKASAKQKEKEKRESAREAERAEQEKKRPAKGKRAERPSEKREKEAGAAEERGYNPWEKWGEQSRVSEKYFSAIRLNPESKEYINKSLQSEIKDTKDQLAEKWFEENKYKLEAKGIPINGLSQEAIVRFAIDPATGDFSKEASDYFKENKELYADDLLKIDNAKALGAEFEKDRVAPESQFLMLNHLEKRTSDLYDQISKLESLGGAENRDKATALQYEIDNLFIARKELAEKATGRDLSKETLARVAENLGYGSKEEYIRDKALISQTETMVKVEKMNALAESEFAALPPKEKQGYKDISDFIGKWQAKAQKLGLSQDQLYALSSAGYKTSEMKKTGFLFFGRGIELTRANGVKVKTNRKEFEGIVKQAEAGYKAGISAGARKELGRRWDQEETGAIISELAITIEESVGGTKAAYERLKQNLAEEYEKNTIREKTAKEQAKQDKEFGKERKKTADILGFMSDALKGEGKFAGLTGDLKKDKKTLKGISEDYGMGISPSAFKKLDAGSYGQRAKNRGGLISLFIELMVKNPYKKFTSAAA